MININKEEGFILPAVLSAILAFIILSGALLTVIETNFLEVGRNVQSQQAFNIAEAGANYYLWHLSHNGADFKDGKTTPTTPDATLGYGPYVHDYVNDNGVKTGTYTLWIKPDGNGSTIATVRAIGQVTGSNVKRTVEARIGAASFASYGLLSDTAVWFGNTESADGPVHSNQGIRMDGASSSDVTSSNATYVPPGSLGGDGASHPGVWCSSSVTTPVNCNTRSKTDWRYPTASVDYNQVTSALCTMKKQAFSSDSATSSLTNLANACSQTPTTRTSAYLPQRSTTGSYTLTKGYLIEFNTNGTYNLFNVNAENDQATNYSTALTLQALSTGVTVPSNGVIFSEDNVWVRTNPTFHGRVTVGAGRLATNSKANAVIADDMVYTTKNGADAIGIVAEDSVILAPYAIPTTGNFNFELDAGIIAQSGNVWYPSTYRTNSNRCTRGWVGSNQKFLYYGSIATRLSWTWTWLVGNSACGDAANSGSGYITGVLNNTTQYDYNLLYAPPPSFPVTTGYDILSWREVLTTP